MYNRLKKDEEWSVERIEAFWKYRQEIAQLDFPYNDLKDDQKC